MRKRKKGTKMGERLKKKKPQANQIIFLIIL